MLGRCHVWLLLNELAVLYWVVSCFLAWLLSQKYHPWNQKTHLCYCSRQFFNQGHGSGNLYICILFTSTSVSGSGRTWAEKFSVSRHVAHGATHSSFPTSSTNHGSTCTLFTGTHVCLSSQDMHRVTFSLGIVVSCYSFEHSNICMHVPCLQIPVYLSAVRT